MALLEHVVAAYVRHAPVRAEIAACSLRDLPVLEARPLDTSMSNAKLRRHIDVDFRSMPAAAAAAVEARLAPAG
jgi:hypothetical protein